MADGIHDMVESQTAAASEGFITFGSGDLWFWDTGGPGEPVILLHAATGSGHSWSHQQPAFVAAGYRVIGYSRRGHRGSDDGADSGLDSDNGFLADDLHALTVGLKLDRFHLVGTAAGSIAAADYALTHPGRVISLALTCSLITTGDDDFMARNMALRPAEWESLPAAVRELSEAYRVTNPGGTARWAAEAELAPPMSRRQPARTPVTRVGLAALTMPILLATGEVDPYLPPGLLRELAAQIPAAETYVFPGCGHSAFWERPELFNDVVLRFLNSSSAAERGRTASQEPS